MAVATPTNSTALLAENPLYTSGLLPKGYVVGTGSDAMYTGASKEYLDRIRAADLALTQQYKLPTSGYDGMTAGFGLSNPLQRSFSLGPSTASAYALPGTVEEWALSDPNAEDLILSLFPDIHGSSYSHVAAGRNDEVRLTNRATGEVVSTGKGYQAAIDAVNAANALSDKRSGNWAIETRSPGGDWKIQASDIPNTSALGQFADIALPVIGSALGGPLGAAAGSALSGVAQGRSIGNIAKGAAISGIGSYLGGELMGQMAPGASTTATSGIGSAINPGAITPAILTGEALSSSLANLGSTAAINAGLSSGLSAGLGSLAGGLGDEIIVNGVRQAVGSGLGSGIGALGGSVAGSALGGAGGGTGTAAAGGPEEIVVTGKPTVPVNTGGAAAGAGIGSGAGTAATGGPEEIVVTGKPSNVATVGGVPIDVLTGLPVLAGTALTTPGATPSKGVLGTGLTASQLLQLGGLGASAIGSLIGGDSSGGGSLVPGGGAVSYTPLNRQQLGRTATGYGFDPFTYGQAAGGQPGEYTFFTPTGAATVTAAKPTTPVVAKKDGGGIDDEIDDENVRHLMEYHKNGGHNGPGPVKGIGTGQDDKIPAWLSDGEYVWSAQDVADLGDGSTDAGVRKLDKMRQMVRKQAGRKDVKKIAKPQKGIDHMLKAVGGMA